MKILVTGGSGFIGSHLIKSLLNKDNHFVTNLDKLTYAANINALDSVKNHPNYDFVHGDISDIEVVKKCFKDLKPNLVMNLAQISC